MVTSIAGNRVERPSSPALDPSLAVEMEDTDLRNNLFQHEKFVGVDRILQCGGLTRQLTEVDSGCPGGPRGTAGRGRLNRSFGMRLDPCSRIHRPHCGQWQRCVSSGKEGVNIEGIRWWNQVLQETPSRIKPQY